MLKLRLIGIRDYSVLEDGQRIGRIRFAGERQPGGLALECRRSSDRPPADWLIEGPRHRQGRLQDGLGRAEGPDHARGSRGSLPGHECP